MNNKRQILTAIIAVLISVGLVATAVYATTTVGDDISVGGDLDIVGTDLQATTGTLNISKSGSVTTIKGTLIVGSGQALAGTEQQLLVEATSTISSTYGTAQWTGAGEYSAFFSVGDSTTAATVSGTGGAVAGYYAHLDKTGIMDATTDQTVGVLTRVTNSADQTKGWITGGEFYARNPSNSMTADSRLWGLRAQIYTGASAETVVQRGIAVSIFDMTTSRSNAIGLRGIDIDINVANAPSGSLYGLYIQEIGAVDLTSGIAMTGGMGYGLDLSGATIGTADIILSSSETISNTSAGTVAFSDANISLTVGDGKKVTIANTDTGSDFGTALEITGGSASTYGESNYTGTGVAEAPITVGQKGSALSITGAGAHAGVQVHVQQDAIMGATTNVLSGLYVTASHGDVASTNGAIEGVSVYARNSGTGEAYELRGGLFMVYSGAGNQTKYKKGLLVDVLDQATTHPSGGGTQGITIQLNPTSITNNMVEGILINQNSGNSIADFIRFSGNADYGLDMSDATIATADIQLSSEVTISSGASDPGTCIKGSIFLNTTSGTLKVCQTTNNWTEK